MDQADLKEMNVSENDSDQHSEIKWGPLTSIRYREQLTLKNFYLGVMTTAECYDEEVLGRKEQERKLWKHQK